MLTLFPQAVEVEGDGFSHIFLYKFLRAAGREDVTHFHKATIVGAENVVNARDT